MYWRVSPIRFQSLWFDIHIGIHVIKWHAFWGCWGWQQVYESVPWFWKMSLTQVNNRCSWWYLPLNSLNNISTCVTNRGLHIVDKGRAVLVTHTPVLYWHLLFTEISPFVLKQNSITKSTDSWERKNKFMCQYE